MSSLQTKRANCLMKTPFQWHNILMPLHVESDSYHHRNIFMHKIVLKNVVFLCFTVDEKFYQHYRVTTFSIWRPWRIFQSPVGACMPKKSISEPEYLKINLNYFLWKLQTLNRQGVSFLLETKHKVFRFKTKPISQMPASKTLKVASNFLSPVLNFSCIGDRLVVIWG